MNPTVTTLPFSRERFVADIAAALKIETLQLNDASNPFEAGLDSIRLMLLLEMWRKAGLVLNFGELAERESIGDWWTLAAIRMNVAI